jgi:hypothetical protein
MLINTKNKTKIARTMSDNIISFFLEYLSINRPPTRPIKNTAAAFTAAINAAATPVPVILITNVAIVTLVKTSPETAISWD